MEKIVDAIADGMVWIAALVLFAIAVKTILPRLFLKVRYDLDAGLGRGLNRYAYPTGRAVVYEPHPSVRKYVNKYALFVNDGYKYLKLSVDGCVKVLKFNVIMLNNKNKVIDVISVNAHIGASSETKEILLHPDTSYVAIDLEAANGLGVKRLVRSYYTVLQLVLYFVFMAVISYAVISLTSDTVESIVGLIIKRSFSLAAYSSFYFLVAALISGIALFVVAVSSTRKGIEVVFRGKK